ncbi:MAG TPA: glycosyltransferase, partial [Thermodesulfovibrionales bacterium]|nr:glycosyltransferase [Thermodesulfovibrionales bacterium]
DDRFYPEHLTILVAKLTYLPLLKVAYTEAEVVFVDVIHGDEMVEKFKYVFYSQDFSPEMLLIQNYIPFLCLLFHRSVFENVRFDENFEIFEDWKILIRLSEKYWFEHIKIVTARYMQWCDKSQINRRALSENFSQVAYKKVLDENIDKITPAAIYTYCVNSATERTKLINEFIRVESEKQRMESEFVETASSTSTEVEGLARKLRRSELDKQRIESEKKRIESERDRAVKELMGLREELWNSLSWRLVELYRRFKDKVAPLGTRRRVFYEMVLKSIKVIQREGMRGMLLRIKRKIRHNPHYLRYKARFKRSESPRFYRETETPEVYGSVQKQVDIIMPVYNGYECLRDCVESILRNTDLAVHTLVIIDDKSTDERVKPYLQRLKEKRNGRKIEMLSNPENMGFVKTINKGMKMTGEDVIILNSDTLVTKNWVNKLQRAAYSKPHIATATPLSNYVTINGIPRPFHFNTIPNGMDAEAFSEFLERISLRYYPEIPAGVGFCMYIRRDVLEHLGYFDEAKFEKGYAEETDFCMRALKKGFLHVLDDSTYIYHVGGVSFESVKDPEVIREKNLMIERNLETLRTLHPEYTYLVGKALDESLGPVHRYINLRIELMERIDEDTLCDRSKT